MNSDIMEILNDLREEKLSAKKALNLINDYKYVNTQTYKHGSKLKITILDKEEGKSIRIPGIPFWIITSLGNVGLSIAKFAARRSNTINDETIKYLNVLDDLDIREIFNVFRNCEPFDIVNIIEEDGDEIKISIL